MSGVPLGLAGHGELGIVDDRGSIALTGSDVVIRWWVGDIDGWHRDAASTVRQAFVDSAPVVESRLRIHRGDARATSFAALSASGSPVVVTELKNRTPAPVVVALVVGPHRSLSVEGATAMVDGTTIVLGRSPSHVLRATDLDSLSAEIDRHTAEIAAGDTAADAENPAEGPGAERGGGEPRFTALLVPVPHTRSVGWVVGSSGGVAGPSDLPTSEQVVSGWASHAASRSLRWVASQSTDAEWFAVTASLLSMEPWGADWSDERLASWCGAAVRLGLDFDTDAVALELVARQSRRGGWGDAEVAPEITLDAVDALLSPWRMGVPAHLLEQLFVPLLRALDFVESNGDRSARQSDLRAMTAAVLVAAGQQRAAGDVERGTGSAPSLPVAAFATNDLGVDAGANGIWDPVAAARRITATVDGEIAVGSGLDISRNWTAADLGLSREIHGVPTPWGLAGVAIRWHGIRPALLWEVLPWSGAPPTEPPSVTASTLAPGWADEGWTGEALLPEPPGVSSVGEIADFA